MSRHKGLLYCSEVKHLLQLEGHKVDGPFFVSKFFGGKSNAVHKDIFGVADLISFLDGEIILHQVTVLNNKADKIHEIQKEKIYPIWVWCRIKESNKVGYRVFHLHYIGANFTIEEGNTRWKASGVGIVGETS